MKNSSWITAGLGAAGISILLKLLGLIPCLNCLLWPIQCVAWFVIPIGCGYFAASWAKLERDQMGEAAKIGTLSGLVLGAVSGITGILISLISSFLNLSIQSTASLLEDNPQYQDILPFTTFGVGSTLLFSCVGFFVGLVFNVVFSLVGAIIKVSLEK